MADVKQPIDSFAKIKVCGIGGGGGSALNRMIRDNIQGVDFIAINTDLQALNQNLATNKVAIGKTLTRGLGAGMNPDIGSKAAQESQSDIHNMLNGADMVFLTCGLGGGTGTGAIPEVAKIAKELGALTVAVVTKPFSFEGAQRRRLAEEGFNKLIQHVDAIITIPNDRVLQIIDKKTSLLDAFTIVDDVLRQGVQGIAELITVPGLINVDFADVKAIMQNSGSALMGIGKSTGENRAVEAAKQAIASPLLELSIDGAKGVLFTITGGSNLSMYEVSEAAKIITGSTDEDAKVIFGAAIDENMKDEVRITVVATGFDSRERRMAAPGAVEIQAQGNWSPSSSLRVRSTPAPAPRPVVQPPAPQPSAPSREPISYNPPPPPQPQHQPQPQYHQPQPQYIPQPPTQPPQSTYFTPQNFQPTSSRTNDTAQTQDLASPPPRSNTPPTPTEEIEIPAFIRKKMM